ncbi:MAG: subclass B1 metallo-beta-lactamase [Spirochaetales bacterium]|nr:subclass B1 metallo-beta-lactamase [Spirochaetales bacterium]
MLRKNFLITLFSLLSLILIAQENRISLTDDLFLEEMAGSDNIYIHRSKIQMPPWGDVWANGLVVIDQKTLIIDTPWNNEQTSLLYQWIKNKTGKSPDYLVITHFHQDCQGGMPFCLEQKTRCYSLELTRDIALEKKLPVAGHYFKDSHEFDLGEITAHALFMGGGHTRDNIVVWIAEKKILFGGCLVKEAKAMGLGNIEDADTESWPKTIATMLDYFPEGTLVIPGHGQQGGKELLEHTLMLATPQIHKE